MSPRQPHPEPAGPDFDNPSTRRRNIALGLALIVGAVAVMAGTYLWAGRDPKPNAWPEVDLGADKVVVYKQTETRDLHLHVFLPDGEPTAAAVMFHGGGFERTPIEQFVPQSLALAQHGAVGFIAEYRVNSDDVNTTDIVADANDAVECVTEHASDYGIPVDRVVAMGASAGGMLAANTETSDPSERGPEALVLYNPAISTRLADPQIPVLVFHGESDRTVSIDSARSYCSDSETCELVTFPGQDHGFFNEEPYLDQTTDLMLAFLKEHDFLP